METLMAQKHKILLVGGMDYNIPKELKECFDVVRHVTQGTKFQTLPQVDFVFVVTEWAGHNLIQAVKAQNPGQIIPLAKGGWNAIKQDLQRRCILPADLSEETPTPTAPKSEAPAESLIASMGESEVWKKYGASLIEAVQVTMKPKEVITLDAVLEVLSLSGVPKVDCETFLPRLQMKGILDPVDDGKKWRLMAAPGHDFENERVEVPGEEKKPEPKEASIELKFKKRVKSPTLVGMIAALPKGPYRSRQQIFEEMRKYIEFDALSDWQAKKYIGLAAEAKIVDEGNEKIVINHDQSLALKRKQEIKAEEVVTPEEIAKTVEKAKTVTSVYAALQPRVEMEKTEAEKAWCYVVEQIKKERDRLASVLVHCRIEYMGGNKILVIFLPSALQQWMKFVESTENWGLVSRTVQARFSGDTVIRFMVDNGLRV